MGKCIVMRGDKREEMKATLESEMIKDDAQIMILCKTWDNRGEGEREGGVKKAVRGKLCVQVKL